jgi:hypothetical protein
VENGTSSARRAICRCHLFASRVIIQAWLMSSSFMFLSELSPDLPSPVSRLPSPVSCLPSPVSRKTDTDAFEPPQSLSVWVGCADFCGAKCGQPASLATVVDPATWHADGRLGNDTVTVFRKRCLSKTVTLTCAQTAPSLHYTHYRMAALIRYSLPVDYRI